MSQKKPKGIDQFFKPRAKATSAEFLPTENESLASSNTESSSLATLTDNQAPCTSDSSGLVGRQCHPEGSFTFPVTVVGNQERSCQRINGLINIRGLITTSLKTQFALYVKIKTRKKISRQSAVKRTSFLRRAFEIGKGH